MSEHDEPKTALARLLGEHGSFTTALGRVLGIDGWAWSCWCGHTEAWSPTDDVYRLHAAHLADVLLAEGYTTSPAPEAAETVEFGLIDHGGGVVINVPPWTHPRDVEQYARELGYRNVRNVRRTRISYADRVTEWVPVDRAADEHEEGGQ